MANIEFPKFTGMRCLMMPYVQGDPSSVPSEYAGYADILSSVFLERGHIGYLTIDESVASKGQPHRGARAKYGRAVHTEAGRVPPGLYAWGGGGNTWGGKRKVWLDRDLRILLASNVGGTCAIWDAEHEDTSDDGDLGHVADLYPYKLARVLAAGEVAEIGILTPHESLPVPVDTPRQFLRIVGSGVHGREPYFTLNPLM
jgi:hypothetical protein